MYCLPRRLADRSLQLLVLPFLVEEVVDVDHVLRVNLVCEFVITCEHLHIAVVNKSRVCLDHVLLHNSRTWHGVVHCLHVARDRLRCNLLSETLLKSLVRKVHSHDDRSLHVVPHLLHCRVVDVVQVVALNDVRSGRELVRHKLSLSERHTAKMHVHIVLLHATLLCNTLTCCLELSLSCVL